MKPFPFLYLLLLSSVLAQAEARLDNKQSATDNEIELSKPDAKLRPETTTERPESNIEDATKHNKAIAGSNEFNSKLFAGFTDEHLHGAAYLIDQAIGKLLGVVPANEKGTRSEFAKYALKDTSNDDLVHATTQELIAEAGFKCETHYVEADDGYITQLIRLINPLADRSQLRRPPVAMFHGGTLDTSIYVAQSTRQHHPERWPRVEGEMHTSWNRSLGFVLANNGYDVWLVGSRGCNRANQGHRRLNKWVPLLSPRARASPKWLESNTRELIKFWSNHTYEDIIEKEIPRQLDRVLHLSGSNRFSIVALSNSVPMTMGLLSTRPDIAARVHNYVAIGPILSEKNSNRAAQLVYRTVTQLGDELGIIGFSEVILSQATRDAIQDMIRSPIMRYTLFKLVTNNAFGPSPKFQTFIEPNLIAHLLLPFGFKSLKQTCQILIAGKVQRYDYGPIENQLRYGSGVPPEYDMSKMRCDNWLVVSHENDPLSRLEDVQNLINVVPKKPYKHIFNENANHLDIVGLADIDIKINLPVLEFMDTFPDEQAAPLVDRGPQQIAADEQIDRELEKFVPPDDRGVVRN